MMSEAFDAARAVLNDSGYQRDVSQIRAKAVLTEVLGSAPAYRWTYSLAQVLRNATEPDRL